MYSLPFEEEINSYQRHENISTLNLIKFILPVAKFFTAQSFSSNWCYFYLFCYTVKPLLSGHPLLSGQKPKSPNLFPLFTLNETFIKRTPLLRGRGQLKSTWNGHFYCWPPVLRHLYARRRKYERLPPTNFSIFTLKNVTWRTYLISFTVQDCFLFRFVCIELVSLIWFLQIWVAIYIYGAMINWFTLINKLKQTSIVIASGSILNISTVHLNDIWHLTKRYLFKPVSGGHHVLSGLQHSPRVSA